MKQPDYRRKPLAHQLDDAIGVTEPLNTDPLNTDDYRNAPSGIGPQAYNWSDKPHRLVYDLCGEIERLRKAGGAGMTTGVDVPQELLDKIGGRSTVPLWPDAGRMIGIGRPQAYAAAKRGEIPGLLRLGTRYLVSTRKLLQFLGYDD